jgi:hypothetical protein
LYSSWPENHDLKPKDYLSKGGRVTVFALKKETPLICAVEQLANYLDNLNTKIVIKVENHFLDDVTSAFEKTALRGRVRPILLCIFFINIVLIELEGILLFYFQIILVNYPYYC